MHRPALLFVALGILSAISSAADIEQTWVIAYGRIFPDGVGSSVPLINGSFPGPTLTGRIGQTVKITVINKLVTDTTTIHWHGIRQRGTPYADGVPGTSQCGIPPGDSYDYEFTLDHAGSLWYHSHSGSQMATLHGAIVILGDEDIVGPYDEDRVMIIGDYFHEDAVTETEGLLASPLRWVGEPQSLLLNGQGVFEDCNDSCVDCNATLGGPFVLNVEPDTTYRIRFVGAASLAFSNVGFEMHNMTVVEVETTPVKPFDVMYWDVGGGQTYSVLLKTKTLTELAAIPNNNGKFWIPQLMRLRKNSPPAYGILSYAGSVDGALPLRPQPGNPSQANAQYSLGLQRRLKSLAPADVPPTANRRFTIVGTQNFLGARVVIAINNITYVDPPTPVILAAKYELDETKDWVMNEQIPIPFNYSLPLTDAPFGAEAKEATQVFRVAKDEVVDFVFQNAVFFGGELEVHPWHLHLHDFWVLGFGDINGAFWNESDEQNYKLSNAVSRNTVGLFPGSWTAIRIKFDNPGAARFHCHIEPHFVMGMGFTVLIGEPDEIPDPPPGIPYCGTIAKMMAPPVRNPLVYGGCSA